MVRAFRFRTLLVAWLAVCFATITHSGEPADQAAAGLASAIAAIQRGRSAAQQAASLGAEPEKSQALRAEARRELEEGRRILESIEEAAGRRIQELGWKIDRPNDSSLAQQRRQARTDLIEAGLYLAGLQYEIAGTYPPQSAEHTERVAAAIRKYGELYDKHSALAGGLHARLWQARLYKESGEPQRTLEALQGMLKLPENDPVFRRLRNESVILLLETCLLPDVKKYPEALAYARQWADSAREDDPSGPDALRIHFLAGTAALEHGRSFSEGDPKRRENVETARKSLEFVVRFPGPLQRATMRKLTDPLFGDWAVEPGRAANRTEARFRGDFAWERLQAVQARLRRQSDEHKDQGPEYEKAQRQFVVARDEALRHYRRAAMSGPDAGIDDCNELRFRVAWLSWASGEMERAAVAGGFLARHYPDRPEARPAAEIAANAWRTLFRQARSEDERRLAADRLAETAEWMAEHWPGSPETDTTWMMLIDTALDRRDRARAEEYLARIPIDSPRRGRAESRAQRTNR